MLGQDISGYVSLCHVISGYVKYCHVNAGYVMLVKGRSV